MEDIMQQVAKGNVQFKLFCSGHKCFEDVVGELAWFDNDTDEELGNIPVCQKHLELLINNDPAEWFALLDKEL